MSAATQRATELQCEATIIEAAQLLGFHVHGERAATSRSGRWSTPIKGDAGWPDLVICGHGHVIAVELKRAPNRVEPAQRAWLDALGTGGVDTDVVWVPEGMSAFITFLADIARQGAPRKDHP